jgi:hypothetical protein
MTSNAATRSKLSSAKGSASAEPHAARVESTGIDVE